MTVDWAVVMSKEKLVKRLFRRLVRGLVGGLVRGLIGGLVRGLVGGRGGGLVSVVRSAALSAGAVVSWSVAMW